MKSVDWVIEQIDIYNKNDPNLVAYLGQNLPNEYVYSLKVVNWVKILLKQPSDTMLIAGHGAHIGRWQVPRSQFAEGLQGYYQWKTFLLKYHAEKVASILTQAEWPLVIIEEISYIIKRKNLKQNAEAQCLEDAVSLIFLEDQLLPLMKKATEEKVINAIQKTWVKMSVNGQNFALQLHLPEECKSIIKKSLGG